MSWRCPVTWQRRWHASVVQPVGRRNGGLTIPLHRWYIQRTSHERDGFRHQRHREPGASAATPGGAGRQPHHPEGAPRTANRSHAARCEATCGSRQAATVRTVIRARDAALAASSVEPRSTFAPAPEREQGLFRAAGKPVRASDRSPCGTRHTMPPNTRAPTHPRTCMCHAPKRRIGRKGNQP